MDREKGRGGEGENVFVRWSDGDGSPLPPALIATKTELGGDELQAGCVWGG